MKRVTWKKPDGTWGVNGVDLKKLEQPAVYGAMVKLMQMEELVEQIGNPETPDWLAEDLTKELFGGPPYKKAGFPIRAPGLPGHHGKERRSDA